MRYTFFMNKIYLSNRAHPLFHQHLKHLGYKIITVWDSPSLNSGLASHPDLFMCKMGGDPESQIFFGDTLVPKDPYPQDIIYNAVCTGKYFIHYLKATNKALLQRAKELEMILIDVRQGYTKCNMVVVDSNSLITSDEGIYNTLAQYEDLECLLIQPGHVKLTGYSTGFIGGASGRIGDQVIFHGNLKDHPNYSDITQFIESRGLKVLWFEEFPLTDIGTIIESEESSQ